MKLLFDQNLSPRLPRLLADIYPESVQAVISMSAMNTQTEVGAEQF
jgi:predicted nuclease of predicted toxin-antitoxin system